MGRLYKEKTIERLRVATKYTYSDKATRNNVFLALQDGQMSCHMNSYLVSDNADNTVKTYRISR